MIDDFNITNTGDNQTQLTFPTGTRNEDIMNVSVTIRDDFLVEVTETVMLYGSTQPELSASFAPRENRITLSILDDDGKQLCYHRGPSPEVEILYSVRAVVHWYM